MHQDNQMSGYAAASRDSTYRQDDLDLLDVIAQLWRGKIIILSTMLIALLLACGYLAVVKEKWTSSAIVTLPAAGQVANYNAALSVLYEQNPRDKPALGELQQQLFDRFSASMSALASELKNQGEPQSLTVEPVSQNSNDSLRFAFVAGSAEEAKKALNGYISKVNDDVVEDYGADIRRSLSVKTRELSDSLAAQKQVALDKKEQRMAVIRQSLKIAEEANITHSQLSQAEFLSDDTLYLLGVSSLKAMIANEDTRPLTFNDLYYETQRALLSLTHLKIQVDNLQSFRFISQPDTPFRRDSPKRSLTLLLALVFGAVLGSAVVIGRFASRQYRLRGK
ncbi:LPS O-antigen chain length determinant protein WzzB [Erwinia sp. B116]|uniref:LPS O-antigen chain length determinant protein WzzB n=1 Tax=Erwinia sp. B116 TaxID=1561024 RepID=UPI000C792F29|nr:LPS O-antigen chain length determinant protein WzzB [Erwinia sp. B116]PLV53859.1 chain length-determining protein [Erwinia sp. B116]